MEEAQTTGFLYITRLKKVYPFHTGPSSTVTDTQYNTRPKIHQQRQLMILWYRYSFLKKVAVALITTSCDCGWHIVYPEAVRHEREISNAER